MIGIKVQDVQIGKRVFYYPFANKMENSEPEAAVITSEPIEMPSGTLCCMIDIRSSVVALSNLSETEYHERRLTSRQRRAKDRYAKYAYADGTYDGISFGEYLKYGLYKEK